MGGICYVDFSGDGRRTACGKPVHDRITVFMTSATCRGCRRSIDQQIDALRPRRSL